MEIKVNDYIRTDKGTIDKITDKNIMIYEVALMGFGEKPIKTSPNIIDLIEVGDYVNGVEVENIDDEWITMSDTKVPILKSIANGLIVSILTKEMFEQMEYKVGE